MGKKNENEKWKKRFATKTGKSAWEEILESVKKAMSPKKKSTSKNGKSTKKVIEDTIQSSMASLGEKFDEVKKKGITWKIPDLSNLLSQKSTKTVEQPKNNQGSINEKTNNDVIYTHTSNSTNKENEPAWLKNHNCDRTPPQKPKRVERNSNDRTNGWQ